MINCLIVEDEKASQVMLLEKIQKNFPEIAIKAIIDNVDETVQFLKKNKIDLIFLDNQIKGGSGLDILKHFENPNFSIIFCTAYSEYAVEALNNKATYYLLKPYSEKEFSIAVERFFQNYYANCNFIIIGNKREMIPHNDILYLESEGAYTFFYLINGKTIFTSKNIGYYQSKLPSKLFFRIHHSIIVNIEMIDQYKSGKNAQVILKEKKITLPISIRKLKEFLSKMNQ